MDVTAALDAPHPPAAVYRCVADLALYPAWLDIVERVEPLGDGSWQVELRGRLGPFARSKLLRMERTVAEPDSLVSFERREHDGRAHSPWVLRAEVAPMAGGSRLTMRLHYGGRLFGPAVGKLLSEEIERSRPRLLALLDGA